MSVREVARYGRWAVLCNGDPMATFARFIVVDGPVDLVTAADFKRGCFPSMLDACDRALRAHQADDKAGTAHAAR
jgi:hypothetical protein